MRSAEQAQELVEFVQAELEQFQNRQIPRISTNEELRVMFGYKSASPLYYNLRTPGLIDERRKIFMENSGMHSFPSPDMAWMIGVLASGGYVGLQNGKIQISTTEQPLLDKFRAIGERVFEADYKQKTLKTTSQDEEYIVGKFTSIRHVRMLGDFRKDRWPETLNLRHTWVVNERPEYIWRFLEGYFDIRSTIDRDRIAFGSIPLVNEFAT